MSARAAGDIALDSVIARSTAGSVNINAGGNTTIAGKYALWTVDNRPGNGWYQNERFIWYSIIEGNTGVNISATGGNLTLNATSVSATNGKASLQALGHINLEAAQEHKLHQASSWRTYQKCSFIFICNEAPSNS